MKNTYLFFLLSLGAPLMQASIVNLDSSAANTTNNSGHATVNLDPNSAWAPALPNSYWISNGITGSPAEAGFYVAANGTTVTFSESFNLKGAITAASLSVMADDTTSVIVNGTTIFEANNDPAGGYPTCSAQPIGCLANTAMTFSTNQLVPYLKSGSNLIQFGVEQKNAGSFGLDYAGVITTSPEPASLALIGSGLLAVALVGRRRRRNSKSSERALPGS